MSSGSSNAAPLQVKMKKVLFTTYRKIFKIAKKVDASTPLRCRISCSPCVGYDRKNEVWEPLDMGKICQWAHSRIFLDALIRHLNGQRQFFLPLPSSAASSVCSSEVAAPSRGKRVEDPCSQHGAPDHRKVSVTHHHHSDITSAAFSLPHSRVVSYSEAKDHSFSIIPSLVAPHSSIAETAHVLFEKMPFSMNHLNNALAAVKELIYITQLPVCIPSHFISPQLQALQSQVSFSPLPSLPTLSPHTHKQAGIFHGLTEKMWRHFQEHGLTGLPESPYQKSDNHGSGSSSINSDSSTSSTKESNPSCAPGTLPAAKTSSTQLSEDSSSITKESPKTQGSKTAGTVTGQEEIPSGATSLCQSPVGEMPNAQKVPAEVLKATLPLTVELLVAHPQLKGYFRHSIMLIVQRTVYSTVALVLNKVLLSEHKYIVPLSSVVRLIRAHEIYTVYLKDHPVLMGGPVISSSMERALTLLHRVPGVANALQVGNANLWMNGDLNDLKAKLDSKEALPQDIAVLCGFAGWGAQQLDGEIALGTWIFAKGRGSATTTTSSSPRDSELSTPCPPPDLQKGEQSDSTGTEKATGKGSTTPMSHTGSEEEGICETDGEILGKYLFELVKTSSKQLSVISSSSVRSSATSETDDSVSTSLGSDGNPHDGPDPAYLSAEEISVPGILYYLGEGATEGQEGAGSYERDESHLEGEEARIPVKEEMPLGGIAAWSSLFHTFSGKMKEVCYI